MAASKPRRKHQHRRRARTTPDAIRKTFARVGTFKGTARALGISVHTVRCAIRPETKRRRAPETTGPRKSKLDPFRPMIKRLILEDQLTGILALEEIRNLGYQGGYSILKEYIKEIRPRRVRPTTFLEHAPGEAQMDWSPYRVFFQSTRETRIVHGFSLVLPYSRYMFVRFALDEQLDTLITLHDQAFLDIGAVAPFFSYDNMTTVGRHISESEVWINPQFAEYAQQCGFDIHLIDPGKPNQHANVERPFAYIEGNCLRRRRFRFADLDDLNRHATWWCDEVANVRIHGTTRERPIDRLARERPFLKPLPHLQPEPFRLLARKVGTDFCIRVDNNRYSTWPKYAGKPATVRLYKERLEILVDGALTAAHPLCLKAFQRLVLPEHEEAFKKLTPKRELLEQAFFRLGAVARDYYEGLRVQRGRGAGYHMQRILKLADRHGASVTTGAMAYAARYGNFNADAIARVIAGRPMPRLRRGQAPESSAQPLSPERARRWVEGLDVEQGRLDDFDRLIERKTATLTQPAQALDPQPNPPDDAESSDQPEGDDSDGQATKKTHGQ